MENVQKSASIVKGVYDEGLLTMCGRFTITVDRVDSLLSRFKAELAPGFTGYQPRYNAAPGQFVPALVTREDGTRFLTNVFWGFVAPWGEQKDHKFTFQANIRDDTIGKNAFFSKRLVSSRCVFIVDGFYEWQVPEGFDRDAARHPRSVRKIPYRIYLKDKEPFALAGLWRTVKKVEEKIVTAGIITTRPNLLIERIHNRMPVILSDTDAGRWLDPGCSDFNTLHSMLAPFPDHEMACYTVSTLVNNSRNDSPQCIEPAA